MQMKSHIRGQAMVETAVFVSLMILSMFVLWWAAREATTHERTYSSLRYGGELLANSTPTEGLSMKTLYATAANGASYSMAATNCSYFDNSLLQGTSTSFHSTLTRAPFISPATSTATCLQTPLAMRSGLSRDLMLNAINGSVTANIAAEKIAPNVLGFLESADRVTISQTFFTEPDLKALTHCYSGVYSAINASLYEGAKGIGASTPLWNTGTSFNALPSTAPLSVSGGCNTSDPGSFSASPPSSIPAPPPQNSQGQDGLGSGLAGSNASSGPIGNGKTIQ